MEVGKKGRLRQELGSGQREGIISVRDIFLDSGSPNFSLRTF